MRRNGWIKLAHPWIDGEEVRSVTSVLKSGILVRGEKCKEFEAKVAAMVGVRYALALNSGTSAILALLHAIGIGSGDEVVLPALSFPAAAECIVMLGARPIFVDVQRDSFNIDPEQVEGAITARTKAIVAIDQFGVPADYPRLENIASAKGVVLIEDAACALGASWNGRACGAFGRGAVLSFHPRKVITTGEGGMVLTDDENIARSVEKLRNHGLDREGKFTAAGLNFRMSEIQAAIGVCQLEKLKAILEKRGRLAAFYRRQLGGYLDFQTPPCGSRATWQTIVAVLKEGAQEEERNRIIAEMAKRRIELQVASFNAARLEPYRDFCRGQNLPVSNMVHDSALALPAHSQMGEEDAAEVCETLKEVLSGRG